MLSKSFILAIGAVASYMAAGILVTLLFRGVESKEALRAIYVGYSLATIVALHCCGFGLPLWYEFSLSKRVPKYLEYAYLVLLLLGLLEIINFAPRYYLYLSSKGNEVSLLAQIATMAEAQIRDNCGKGPQHFKSGSVNVSVDFPADYCETLAGLVKGDQQKQAVINVAKDRKFMGRVVTRVVTSRQGEFFSSEHTNPIAELIHRLAVLDTFQKYSGSDDSTTEAVLKWVAMLLLPVGIGLRALKTSLELFADLK